jgi:hypothetical protein
MEWEFRLWAVVVAQRICQAKVQNEDYLQRPDQSKNAQLLMPRVFMNDPGF